MPQNAILSKMLERLYASILSGPALNCRPHSSRQRVDLSQLTALDGTSAKTILAGILGEEAQAKLIARVAEPPAEWIHQDKLTHSDKSRAEKSTEADKLTPEQQAVVKAWQDQQGLLKKLNVIAGDVATYEQDTGAHVLYLGFPILSFPPQSTGERTLRRIFAPILFIPLNLEIKSGRAPSDPYEQV